MKLSDTGKIEAIVYEEGAARGERVELDLDLLAAAATTLARNGSLRRSQQRPRGASDGAW